ncbi:MAG: hypothetical protein ABEH58_06800, partial [Haloplanus sp.]
MRRGALPLVLVVLLAGCTAPITTPTDTAEPTPTPTATTPTPEPVAVEYAVGAGSIPDKFGSMTVTLQVVFAERAAD